MRNRAKCKLCESIIESFHRNDYVTCKCGEISVDGGTDYYRCIVKDWDNFVRIDDLGNEIKPRIVDKEQETSEEQTLEVTPQPSTAPNKTELLDMLKEMIKNIEGLPPHAMTTPINHYDFLSALLLLRAIFFVDCTDDS